MTGQRSAGFKQAAGLAMVRVMHIRAVPALFAVFLVALTLAGCGRKSGIDLPPSAAAAPAVHEEKEADAKTLSPISKPAKPKPRVVPQRSLPIDILLN
jgi:predicted small lipoprotein YifL